MYSVWCRNSNNDEFLDFSGTVKNPRITKQIIENFLWIFSGEKPDSNKIFQVSSTSPSLTTLCQPYPQTPPQIIATTNLQPGQPQDTPPVAMETMVRVKIVFMITYLNKIYLVICTFAIFSFSFQYLLMFLRVIIFRPNRKKNARSQKPETLSPFCYVHRRQEGPGYYLQR